MVDVRALTSDLDEDLDATALEEVLVDPDDYNPPSSSAPPVETRAAPPVTQHAPPAGDYGAVKLEDQDGMDRIRPSDMPDEGLVVSSKTRTRKQVDVVSFFLEHYGRIKDTDTLHNFDTTPLYVRNHTLYGKLVNWSCNHVDIILSSN